MKFLLASGGEINKAFGVMTSPSMRGIPEGIKNGLSWAGDNGAFSNGFQPDIFFSWLKTLEPYKNTCLFITIPDVLMDAQATQENYSRFRPLVTGFPCAYVAQDGMTELPDVDYQVLFIGGSTEYKLSNTVTKLIREAQLAGKRIHIGRVNYRRRYNHFAMMNGSKEFTCDGTRMRFGRSLAIRNWLEYMGQDTLFSHGEKR